MADRGFQMVRFADDIVILCRSRPEAEEALRIVREWTEENELTLHPTKTKIVDAVTEGFEFLGFRYFRRTKFLRSKSVWRLTN